jgi:outer membrane protein TolC
LLQQKNLAMAENQLISAQASYAQARAAMYEMLASTLQHYGINLPEAATGNVTAAPVVPGLTPAKTGNEPAAAPPAAQ